MDVTYEDVLDPCYFPLPPSIDDLLTYAAELEAEGHYITFEWADSEIKNHFLSYVRVGLVAGRVKLYKLYRHTHPQVLSFAHYCEICLGKSLWYVNRLIEAARVTLELARAGFTILPQCEAQARPLTKFFGDELISKWQEVLDKIPSHRLTAAGIAAIVDGELKSQKRQVCIEGEIWSQLTEKAILTGMSPAQLLRKLVQEYEPEPPTEETDTASSVERDEDRVTPVTPQQLADWIEDLQQLLIDRYGIATSTAYSTTSY